MKPIRALLLILLIALSTSAPASGPANDPIALAQRLEVELTMLTDSAGREGADIDATALARIEAEVNAGTGEWMRRRGRAEDTSKLGQLLGLLANAHRYNELRQLRTPADLPYSELEPGLAVRASTDESLGASCASPMDLATGSALAPTLAAAGTKGDAFWVRVRSTAAGRTAISTLGSRGDTEIAVYGGCADAQALISNDDYYGLQALALLPTQSRSAYLVRVGNRDAARPVRARIAAILASGFSGKVSISPAGAVSSAGLIVSNFTSISGYYTGTVGTDANGNYAMMTSSNGTFYARTGNAYSQSGSVLHEAYGDVICTNGGDTYSLSSCGPGQPAPITVAGNLNTDGIDFDLGLGHALSFRLSNEVDGTPLTGATASLSWSNFSSGTAYADGAGRVSFLGLRPGIDYRAAFNAEGFRPEAFDNIPCVSYCQTGQGTPITFQAGDPYFREHAVGLAPTRKLVVYVRDLPQANYSAAVNLLYASGQVAQNAYVYYSSPIPGYRSVTFVDVPVGTYYVQAGYPDASFWRLHPNVDCLTDCQSLLNQASAITVTANQGTQEYFLDPRPFPAVRGNVVDQLSGAPVAGATAYLIPLSGVGSQLTVSVGQTGEYRFNYARPGSYLVAVSSPQHVDVAYPNAPCVVGGYTPVCPSATPVTVVATQSVFQFDFSLTQSGRVEGSVAIEGMISSGSLQLRLRRATGTLANGVLQLAAGRYSLSDVDPGLYSVIVEDSLVAYGQAYPGVDCAGTACVSSALGQLLTLGEQPVTGVDFNLRLQRGAKGRVLSASTGEPLAGVVIDMWSESTWGANYVRSGVSGTDGRFVLPATDSYVTSYRLATSVGNGYINEVYNNVPCPLGPAYLSLCDLSQGDTVPALHPINGQGITFRLVSTGGDSLFADGLED